MATVGVEQELDQKAAPPKLVEKCVAGLRCTGLDAVAKYFNTGLFMG